MAHYFSISEAFEKLNVGPKTLRVDAKQNKSGSRGSGGSVAQDTPQKYKNEKEKPK